MICCVMTAFDAMNRRVTVVPELLTVAETAMECRVSAHTVRRWIADGRLEHVALPSGGLRIPIEALTSMQRLPRLAHGQSKSARRAS